MKKIITLLAMLSSLSVFATTKLDLIVQINYDLTRPMGFFLGNEKAWGTGNAGKYKFKANVTTLDKDTAKILCKILRDKSNTEREDVQVAEVETTAIWGKQTEVVHTIKESDGSDTTFRIKFTTYKVVQ